MSLVQRLLRLLRAILPRPWAAAMEAESRTWLARCQSCDHERSIWELGGIRWKAAGEPTRLLHCPRCGGRTRHLVHRTGATAG